MASREMKAVLAVEGGAEFKQQMTDAANAIRVLNSAQELSDAQFDEVFRLMNPEGGKYPPMNDPSLAGKFNQKMKQTR